MSDITKLEFKDVLDAARDETINREYRNGPGFTGVVSLKDNTGRVIFQKRHNLIVLRGRTFALERLFSDAVTSADVAAYISDLNRKVIAFGVGKGGAPAGALRRQETGEQEAVARQARQDQRRQGGGGAGQRHHREALVDGVAHQLVAGVRHQGRAGIADQRHHLAPSQPCQNPGPHFGSIVVVIGDERLGDAVDRQQLGGDAGILGGDAMSRL